MPIPPDAADERALADLLDGSGDPAGDAERLWRLAWAERPRLLRLARRYCPDPADAEDVVSRALLACVTYDRLDPVRLGPLLTTMTMRLCVDAHRARDQATRLQTRAVTRDEHEPSPEQELCDLAEARWLRGQLHHLSLRERQVLLARAAGADPAHTAAELGISRAAVRAALTRARVKLRQLLLEGPPDAPG